MIRILALLVPFATVGALAQADSVTSSTDTSVVFSDAREDLLEQSDDLDESSIFEYLTDEDAGRSLLPHLRVRTRIAQRLQPSAGYEDGTYEGSRLKASQRITASLGKLGAGFLVSKDAGEKFSSALMTGYLAYRGEGVLRQVVAGDFRIEAGQGIAFWRGRDLSKGSDILTPVMRHGRGIVPSVSSDETSFLRGVAAEGCFGDLSAKLLYSVRAYGGTMGADGFLRSFTTTGYYRTESEQLKRDAVGERLIGIRLETPVVQKGFLGLTMYRAAYTAPLSLVAGARFTGTDCMVAAFDFSGNFSEIVAFGEAAIAGPTIGGIAGIALFPSGAVHLVCVGRAYPLSFYSPHGSGFGDLPGMYNEYGICAGARWEAGNGILLTGYVDHAMTPMNLISHFPVSGDEILGALAYSARENLVFSVQYYRSSKSARMSGESDDPAGQSGLGRALLQRVRLQSNIRFSSRGEVRLRCEESFRNISSVESMERGFLMYGDLALRISRALRGNFRLIFFGTDSYATRITEYERDLDGVATVPGLYGSGIRWYVVVRFDVTKAVRLSGKYSDVLRDDVRTIGNGLEALGTNHDDRLSVQLDVKI